MLVMYKASVSYVKGILPGEYYEIFNEGLPSIVFSPTNADFLLQKCISNHESKQSSNSVG